MFKIGDRVRIKPSTRVNGFWEERRESMVGVVAAVLNHDDDEAGVKIRLDVPPKDHPSGVIYLGWGDIEFDTPPHVEQIIHEYAKVLRHIESNGSDSYSTGLAIGLVKSLLILFDNDDAAVKAAVLEVGGFNEVGD